MTTAFCTPWWKESKGREQNLFPPQAQTTKIGFGPNSGLQHAANLDAAENLPYASAPWLYLCTTIGICPDRYLSTCPHIAPLQSIRVLEELSLSAKSQFSEISTAEEGMMLQGTTSTPVCPVKVEAKQNAGKTRMQTGSQPPAPWEGLSWRSLHCVGWLQLHHSLAGWK